MNAITRHEKERLCGRRKPGGIYAVNPAGTAAGSIPVNCDFALIEPVPIPPEFGSRRGYIYVDGHAILERHDSAIWRVSPDAALRNRYAWVAWGLPPRERATRGVCANAFARFSPSRDIGVAVERVLENLVPLPREYTRDATRAVLDALRDMRAGYEGAECPFVPAVWAMHRLQSLADGDHMQAAKTLATAWEIAHAVRWACDLPGDLSLGEKSGEGLLSALQAVMIGCGALADAAYLAREFPRAHDPRRFVADMLDWVGARYYPTDDAFVEEAREQGISRRMPTLTKGAQPGVSRVFLAHPNCQEAGGQPAVFGYYYLAELQYVVEREDEAMPDDLESAGVVPVHVVAAEDANVPSK